MLETLKEVRKLKTDFFKIRGFPNVIDCIDGSHVPIQSPGGDNVELFGNRKGFFSVNVQCICDAIHDSTMFNAS